MSTWNISNKKFDSIILIFCLIYFILLIWLRLQCTNAWYVWCSRKATCRALGIGNENVPYWFLEVMETLTILGIYLFKLRSGEAHVRLASMLNISKATFIRMSKKADWKVESEWNIWVFNFWHGEDVAFTTYSNEPGIL